MRIVVLGGGFGGVATVRHLERVLRRTDDVEITLVSRENFFMLTPLLFEACSGRLELRSGWSQIVAQREGRSGESWKRKPWMRSTLPRTGERRQVPSW